MPDVLPMPPCPDVLAELVSALDVEVDEVLDPAPPPDDAAPEGSIEASEPQPAGTTKATKGAARQRSKAETRMGLTSEFHEKKRRLKD